jgi:hypothetical protein
MLTFFIILENIVKLIYNTILLELVIFLKYMQKRIGYHFILVIKIQRRQKNNMMILIN